MASIDTLRASDGSGNASVATVQSPRSAMATTLVVDTVQGINGTFHATMGTPHTFVDPVTNETITVISEATAVDFQGHVDGTNLEIDVIAPGFTDNGSAVNDIVIIKPTTQWADEVADVLAVEHKDDGTHGDITCDSITINGTASAEGWSPLGATPNTVTANGNRSYDLVFNGTDLTDTITEGMRVRTARTVAAPIQCATFDGTNDYFSKSSPSSMTFTDDFSVSAWVKLSSYPGSGTVVGIVSRYNGTSGWSMYVDASGIVQFNGYNGSAVNKSYVQSYQSLPLNRWVHIAAQLDMSAFTATTTTSYMMFDGISIPVSIGRVGTNPTALVQAGNLEIGSRNGGSEPFPGKIAQVAIYSAKVAQADHLARMNQGLTGSEPNLISAYTLSNSLEDLSANNNDLTANGGVLTTTADSPFGNSGVSTTLDYAVVMAKSFSTNTTLTVQVPEGCTIPTSGGVSSMDYSTQSVPYGFTRDRGRWRIKTMFRDSALATASNATYGAFLSGGYALTVPAGAWYVGHKGVFTNATTTTVTFNISSTALTGLTLSQGLAVSEYGIPTKASTAVNTAFYGNLSLPQTHATAKTYVMYTLGSTTQAAIDTTFQPAEIYAENAYI